MTILCMIIIFSLAMMIYLLLMTVEGDIGRIELPIAYVAKGFGRNYGYLYGITILSAIITTAISSAYGFLENMANSQKQYQTYNKCICFGAIFVSFLGFSNLVQNLYPIFGILGMIQLCLIAFYRK